MKLLETLSMFTTVTAKTHAADAVGQVFRMRTSTKSAKVSSQSDLGRKARLDGLAAQTQKVKELQSKVSRSWTCKETPPNTPHKDVVCCRKDNPDICVSGDIYSGNCIDEVERKFKQHDELILVTSDKVYQEVLKRPHLWGRVMNIGK